MRICWVIFGFYAYSHISQTAQAYYSVFDICKGADFCANLASKNKIFGILCWFLCTICTNLWGYLKFASKKRTLSGLRRFVYETHHCYYPPRMFVGR